MRSYHQWWRRNVVPAWTGKIERIGPVDLLLAVLTNRDPLSFTQRYAVKPVVSLSDSLRHNETVINVYGIFATNKLRLCKNVLSYRTYGYS